MRTKKPVDSDADETLGGIEQHPLDREEPVLAAVLRRAAREALDDASPAIPADRVFEDL